MMEEFGFDKMTFITSKNMDEVTHTELKINGLIMVDPLGYLDFLNLMANSKIVLTDSGGMQEETTFLGIPCITLRDNTERPVTIEEGTNVLVGSSRERLIEEGLKALNGNMKKGSVPELWDGRAAERIAEVIIKSSR